MTNDEIEKLKKKLEKDPLSKFFVPLAEEYKKRGRVEEAINLLLGALVNRPDYTSARVALGKIYFDKKMLSEAQEEFEKVTEQIPDNLFAHRKLANIYYQLKDFNRATEECRAVLFLNPNDNDALEIINALESSDEGSGKTETPSTSVDKDSDSPKTVDTAVEKDAKTKESPAEKTVTASKDIDKKTDASESPLEIPEKLAPIREFPIAIDTNTEKSEKTDNDHSTRQGKRKKRRKKSKKSGEAHVSHHTAEADISEKPVSSKPTNDRIIISMPTDTMADIFITQGLYDKAMNVYKELLLSDPGNKRISQRCEELKMLMKITDKKDNTNR